MSTLTIRRVSDTTHARLRARAAKHGRSVEAEVRAILDAEVEAPRANILLAIHDAFSDADVSGLELPERTDLPRPMEIA